MESLQQKILQTVKKKEIFPITHLVEQMKVKDPLKAASCKYCKGAQFVLIKETKFDGTFQSHADHCFCSFPVEMSEEEAKTYWLSQGAVDATAGGVFDPPKS